MVIRQHRSTVTGCWKPSRTNNKSDLDRPISPWSSHVKTFHEDPVIGGHCGQRTVPGETWHPHWASSSLFI